MRNSAILGCIDILNVRGKVPAYFCIYQGIFNIKLKMGRRPQEPPAFQYDLRPLKLQWSRPLHLTAGSNNHQPIPMTAIYARVWT
jgi:hypothetical protein